MSNKYHAGTEYTNEQRDQLDAAFQAWLDLDQLYANHEYDDEPAHVKATAAYRDYEALQAKFDAANAPTKRGVAYGHGLEGFDFIADELLEDAYIHSHPGNGYGL